MFTQTLAFLKKEILLEWRQRHALNGMLLYMVCTIFITYLGFSVKVAALSAPTWNVLFWIIIMFAAFNAVAKSFLQESENRALYYYMLIQPQALILARIVYHTVLMMLMSILGFVLFTLVHGSPVVDSTLFLFIILIASVSFASALTMIAAIASRGSNSTTLMAILGFPVILPMLLMIIKISNNAIDGLDWSASYDELAILGAINLIVLALSFILFPYLWKR